MTVRRYMIHNQNDLSISSGNSRNLLTMRPCKADLKASFKPRSCLLPVLAFTVISLMEVHGGQAAGLKPTP